MSSRVEDRAAVEVDLGRMRRHGAGRDHDRSRRRAAAPSRRDGDDDRLLVGEARVAVDRATWFRRSWSRMICRSRSTTWRSAQVDVLDRDLVLEPIALAVDRALVEPGQVEDRLADRLRRDRPRVDARAAEIVPRSTSATRLSELRRPGWPPSDRPGRSRSRRGRTALRPGPSSAGSQASPRAATGVT